MMYNIIKDRIVEGNMRNNPSDFGSKVICEYRRGVNMSDNIIMAGLERTAFCTDLCR